MSIPGWNRQFVSDSSTNVTDWNAPKNSSFQLSPVGSMKHSNKKIRKHALGFVSSKELEPRHLATSTSGDVGGWPSQVSRYSLPKKKGGASPPLAKMTSTQGAFPSKALDQPARTQSEVFHSDARD